MKAFTFKIL